MGWFSRSLKSKTNRFAKTMPKRVSNMIARHFDDNFEKGGWQKDKTVRMWQPRKKHYKHPTLDKSGKLRASQKVTYTDDKITVEYTSSYAKYHNAPTGTHGDNIQRQFVGDNKALNRKIKKFIIQEYKKILR